MRALLVLGVFLLPAFAFAQTADTTPPTLITISIESDGADPAFAKIGDTVTLTIVADEPLLEPTLNILGEALTAVMGADQTTYSSSIVVGPGTDQGPVTFLASFEDLEGNDGEETSETNDGSSVTIDRTEPSIADEEAVDIVAEAESAAGTVVAFTGPTATDNLAGTFEASCTPSSGSTFAIGTTTVSCTAVDQAGNASASVLFDVVVRDTTAPSIELVGASSMTIAMDSPFVDPGVNATDAGDDTPDVSITGFVDIAAAGTYTLTYTATDDSGNSATALRSVTVESSRGGSGGGGGGGGGSSSSSAPRSSGSISGGEVLGATTYNFIRHLKQGDIGQDVTELQNMLRTSGHFTGLSTGYFGPQTAAALASYQAANGLEAVGFVGPKTLALLNGGVATNPQISALIAQIALLQAEIARLKALQ